MTHPLTPVVVVLAATLLKFASPFTVPTSNDGGSVNNFANLADSSGQQPWWTDYASVACAQPDFIPAPGSFNCTLKNDVYTVNELGLGNNWHEWCIVCPYNAASSSVQEAKLNEFLVWLTTVYASKTDFNQNVADKNFTRLQIVVTDMPTSLQWSVDGVKKSLAGASLTSAEMLYTAADGPSSYAKTICTQSVLTNTPPECTGPFVPTLSPNKAAHGSSLSSLAASVAAVAAAVVVGRKREF